MKVKVFGDLNSITNKTGTNELVLKFITQEINDEEAGLVMGLRNKYLCLILSSNDIPNDEAEKELPDEFQIAPMVDSKKPSTRLRAVLWQQWNNRYKMRYPDFDNYYKYRMELIIDDEKERI